MHSVYRLYVYAYTYTYIRIRVYMHMCIRAYACISALVGIVLFTLRHLTVDAQPTAFDRQIVPV